MDAAERNNIGNSLLQQGDYDGAITAYQAAQVVSSDLPEPYFNVASAFAMKGELNKARSALEQALKTSDSYLTAQAYYNLGNIFFQMRLFQDAIESYKQTLRYSPEDNDARYNLELALTKIIPLAGTDNSASDNPTDITPEPTHELPVTEPNIVVTSPNLDTENLLSLEEAESLLDALQQDQDILGSQSQTTRVPDDIEKDW